MVAEAPRPKVDAFNLPSFTAYAQNVRTEIKLQILPTSNFPNHRPTNFPIDSDSVDNPRVTVTMGT